MFMNKEKLATYSFYLWLLFWPWQTKFILVPSESNYLEISFFASWILLILPFFIWGKEILKKDYWRFSIKDSRPLWWLGLIIFEITILVSILFSSNILLAAYHYFIFALALFLFYTIKARYIPEKYFSIFFLIGLIPPAVLGIWQFYSQQTLAFKWLGLADHSVSTLGSSVVETNFGRYLRAYGSFDHPNILGGIMAVALIYILYLSFKDKISKKIRLLYLGAFSVFYCALLLSFSRTAILAFIVSAPLILLKAKKISKSLLLLYFFIIIGLGAAIIIPNKDLYIVRTSVNSRLEQKSLDERGLYLEQAISLIKKRPVLGVGTGNYVESILKSDNNFHPLWFYQPVHNYWLLLWSEIGILGLIGALIFWFSCFKLAWFKNMGPLILVFLIISFFDHWLWTSALGLMLFFMIVAVIFREDN